MERQPPTHTVSRALEIQNSGVTAAGSCVKAAEAEGQGRDGGQNC